MDFYTRINFDYITNVHKWLKETYHAHSSELSRRCMIVFMKELTKIRAIRKTTAVCNLSNGHGSVAKKKHRFFQTIAI